MSRLIDELKRKYQTPQAALSALGLDAALLNHKESSDMATKPVVLTRKATATLGALVAYLKPKLASDAKPNLPALLKDVTQKNFAAKKPAIIEGLKGLKLAKDANIQDVAQLLDALEKEEVAEGDDLDPNSGLPVGHKEEEAMDDDPMEKAHKLLEGKISAEDMAALDAIFGGKRAHDETPEEKEERERKEKEAKDAAGPEMKPDMVSKKAMDEAISAAVKKATEQANTTQRQIRDAEREVEPWVGKLAMAHDSAESVYRTALGALGVKVDGVHADALKPILMAQPKPSDKRREAAPIAMDESASADFDKMFPGASRIGNLG